MKVCIVSMRLPSYYGVGEPLFGGAEVQAAFVADALRVAGQEVVLVVADMPEGAKLPFPAENAYHSTEGIPGARFFHPRWSGAMKALERADADVYFQHCAGMITGLVSIFCRRHERVFVYGGGSDRDFLPRRVPVSRRRDRMLFRYGIEHCTGIVVQNEKQHAAARQLNKPLKLIPTGVRPAGTGAARHRDVIVWIGSLWSHKRPDRLIELARRVPDREFVMLGGDFPSEPAYSEQIRREARGVPNLTLMGRRPHEEVALTLERATMLVNTSDMEGFPNAYLEAWSHGVPVVTFLDVDSIIATSGAGVVAKSMDEMEASIRLLSDESRRNQMGEAARRLVHERFSPEHLGAEYVDFFSSLR